VERLPVPRELEIHRQNAAELTEWMKDVTLV
jgi:hypothetical protein